MAVKNKNIFDNVFSECGAGASEVLLAMAIVALSAPLVYSQITAATRTVENIAVAEKIMSVRKEALDFVRANQDTWPDEAQIHLSPQELKLISDVPVHGFVDKYTVSGAAITDIYLAFDTGFDALRTNSIAHNIGVDAAVVGSDGVAYGASWAVAAPDFVPGNLIYRVSRDFTGEDKSRYLHRTTSGNDDLNKMERNLLMGGLDIQDIGTIVAKKAKVRNANTNFVSAEKIATKSVYFSSGANMEGQKVTFGNMHVSGDITGFRNITADNLNGNRYTTTGNILADKVTVTKSVNVSGNLNLKSSSAHTVSGFSVMSVGMLVTPYVDAGIIYFYGDFGLTVSSELLETSTTPLKIGSWSFAPGTLPEFGTFHLTRASVPAAINSGEFGALMREDWQTLKTQTASDVVGGQ